MQLGGVGMGEWYPRDKNVHFFTPSAAVLSTVKSLDHLTDNRNWSFKIANKVIDNVLVRQTNQHVLFTGKHRYINTKFVLGNSRGRGYNCLTEESVTTVLNLTIWIEQLCPDIFILVYTL